MKIPEEFTLFGNKITVREIEKDEENRYGYWDDANEEVVIAHKVKVNGEPVTLKQSQIESTFLHEVLHAFQWYSRGSYDEVEAQTYSMLLMEFMKSSKIKIDPNTIHESVNNTHNE